MSELPLLEGVLNYIKENNISFCMPGHKNGRGFLKYAIGKKFLNNIGKFDITEVDGVDNLHDQHGIILEASKKLSNFYHSSKSYFLVNGSTSGNMVMIFASLNEGDKVIVERNCHKSIMNSIIMRKLVPVYVENTFNKKLSAPSGLNLEHFLKIVEHNRDARAVIVTYPNYYGICSNLEFIVNTCKKYNMKVLVDSAHGAHFGVSPCLPESAVKLGADMVVTSAHKTLPSFTQTAYLHVNNEEDIERADFYFNIFLSTSPSYLALCSMDYARFYLEKSGREDYERLVSLADTYRKKINSIEGLRIMDKAFIENVDDAWNIDTTRYVLNLERGYRASKLSEYLRKNGIQIEMNDGKNLVMILSPFNFREDFEKLYQVLKGYPMHSKNQEIVKYMYCKIPEMKVVPWKVLLEKHEVMDLDKAVGKICASSIVPYPPGVPVIYPGELIDLDVVSVLEYYISVGVELIGLHDGKIKVLSCY